MDCIGLGFLILVADRVQITITGGRLGQRGFESLTKPNFAEFAKVEVRPNGPLLGFVGYYATFSPEFFYPPPSLFHFCTRNEELCEHR